jgi:hypothetical protein
MPISYGSHFPLCEFCGKPQIPPGIVLLTYGPVPNESLYCEGHEDRVCCPHCGLMVHIRMHPFRACEYFHRLYDTSGDLRVDKVLQEAETILREARGDSRWEGAD